MNEWKRTGHGEYPEDGQKCMIYFYHTGYSISTFFYSSWVNGLGEDCPELGKTPCFSDEHGTLGDEDVLWMPIEVALTYMDNRPPLPSDYVNDKSFKRWDDPEKAYKHVILDNDFHYVRNPKRIYGYNHFEIDIPKGSILRVTSDRVWKNDGILGEGKEIYQCAYDDGKDLHIVYLSPDKVREVE